MKLMGEVYASGNIIKFSAKFFFIYFFNILLIISNLRVSTF